MANRFDDFDFESFWEENDYAEKEFVEAPFDGAMVARIENELGYKLPQSYLEFMSHQNGGYAEKCYFPLGEHNGRERFLTVGGFFGIGETKPYSLLGRAGSKFWIDDWGFPDIGIYFAEGEASAHTQICFDYRNVGEDGEPCITYIDQEADFAELRVADNFEVFVKALTADADFGESYWSTEEGQRQLEEARQKRIDDLMGQLHPPRQKQEEENRPSLVRKLIGWGVKIALIFGIYLIITNILA